MSRMLAMFAGSPASTERSEPRSARRGTRSLGLVGGVLSAVLLGGMVAGTAIAEAAPAPVTTATAHPTQSVSSGLWAAIALGPNSLATGYAWNYPSADAASRAAVARCGARDCQAIVQVTDGCAALAQASNYTLGWDWAGSLSAAEQGARQGAGASNAQVLGWACSGYLQ